MAKKPTRKKTSLKPAKEKPMSDRSNGPVLHALLIGCDFYLPNVLPEGSYGSLRGCVRDVERVEGFLRRRGNLTDDRLIKLTSSHGGANAPLEVKERWPTYENIIGGFRTVTKRAQPGD